MSKKQEQVQKELVCGGCLHHRPVTWEHLTPERQPIFCTCSFVPKYHFLHHNVTHRNCQHYEAITTEPTKATECV